MVPVASIFPAFSSQAINTCGSILLHSGTVLSECPVPPSLVVSSELEDQDLRSQLGMEGLLRMNPKSEAPQCGVKCRAVSWCKDRSSKRRPGASGTWGHSGKGMGTLSLRGGLIKRSVPSEGELSHRCLLLDWRRLRKMDANSAQVLLLPQILPRCVLRLGPFILILRATSDLDGGAYNDMCAH